MDSINHILRRQPPPGTPPPPSKTPGMPLPAMPPPPGVIPDFVHPESSAQSVVVCSVVFTVVTGIFVSARMYTRYFISHSVGYDDYICLVAMALSIALCVLTMYLVKYGLGVHIWNVPLTTFSPHFLQHLMAPLLMQTLLPSFAKISVLLLYLRVFGTSMKMTRAVYATVAFICVYTIIFVFLTIFRCSPVAKSWDVTITGGKCLNPAGLTISGGASNALADLIVLLLPLPLTLKLQVTTRQKIAVVALFFTGGFAAAVSIIRLNVYVQDTYKSFDLTWSAAATILWCIVEANVSIICACVLTLKPFIRRFFPKILELSTDRTKGTGIMMRGSRIAGKSFLASKAGENKAWSQYEERTPKDGTYLELGEGGINETIVGSQSNSNDSQPAISPDEGKIVRTREVDISERDMRGRIDLLPDAFPPK